LLLAAVVRTHNTLVTIISLFSLFGFVAQAEAQASSPSQPSVSPKSRVKTAITYKTKTAGGTSSGYAVLYSFSLRSELHGGAKPEAVVIRMLRATCMAPRREAAIMGGTVFKLDPMGGDVLYSFRLKASGAGCPAI
jgi:hypothetical protein